MKARLDPAEVDGVYSKTVHGLPGIETRAKIETLFAREKGTFC